MSWAGFPFGWRGIYLYLHGWTGCGGGMDFVFHDGEGLAVFLAGHNSAYHCILLALSEGECNLALRKWLGTGGSVVGAVVVEHRPECQGQAALVVASAIFHEVALARRDAVLPLGASGAGKQDQARTSSITPGVRSHAIYGVRFNPARFNTTRSGLCYLLAGLGLIEGGYWRRVNWAKLTGFAGAGSRLPVGGCGPRLGPRVPRRSGGRRRPRRGLPGLRRSQLRR